jgi:hypothetical protein
MITEISLGGLSFTETDVGIVYVVLVSAALLGTSTSVNTKVHLYTTVQHTVTITRTDTTRHKTPVLFGVFLLAVDVN